MGKKGVKTERSQKSKESNLEIITNEVIRVATFWQYLMHIGSTTTLGILADIETTEAN